MCYLHAPRGLFISVEHRRPCEAADVLRPHVHGKFKGKILTGSFPPFNVGFPNILGQALLSVYVARMQNALELSRRSIDVVLAPAERQNGLPPWIRGISPMIDSFIKYAGSLRCT